MNHREISGEKVPMEGRRGNGRHAGPADLASGSTLHNERGIVLVISLVMIVLLGMLGAMALNRSSTELHITGNYRNQQIAYYNATNVLEGFGPNNQNVLTTIQPNVQNFWPAPVAGVPLCQNVALAPGTFGTSCVQVAYICSSSALNTLASDQGAFISHHFLVQVIGRGIGDATNASEYVVEQEITVQAPKPENFDPDC